MNSSRKIKWSLAASCLILTAGLILYERSDESSGIPKSQTEDRDTYDLSGKSNSQAISRHKVRTLNNRSSQISKERLLGRLQDAEQNPEELLKLVPSVSEELTGVYSEDMEYYRIYIASFNSFTPEQIEELVSAWPKGIKRAILLDKLRQNLLDGRENSLRIIDVMNHLPNSNSTEDFIKKISKYGDLFSPDNIAQTMKSITFENNQSLGEGLSERILNLPKQERLSAVKSYYRAIENPELIRGLAPYVVDDLAETDVNAARKWLLEGKPELVQAGDANLVREMAKHGRSDESVDFVNTLIERGEIERANSVLKSVAHYDRGDPEKLYLWGASLPKDFSSRNQVMTTAFIKLIYSDLKKAETIADKVQDESLKKSLHSVLETHKK